MNCNEDKKRFSVVMYWLASVMKDIGGKPKLMTIPANKETRTPEVNVQRDYYEALQDIRIERIEWAAKHIFKTETWFPMPKEIRAAAMLAPSSVLPPLPLNQTAIPEFTEQQREEAAQKLDDIINGFGDWGSV
jgi:hypothetical protein